MEFDGNKHIRVGEDRIREGVRGFVVEKCAVCPLREEILGGYDRDEVWGYTCLLYRKRIDVCDVFPTWCKLRPMDIQWNEMCNTLGVVRKMVKDLGEVIECGYQQ